MKQKPTKTGGRANPLNDFLFLKTMGEKGDEEQLLSFLNAVLGRTGANRFASIDIIENKKLAAEIAGGKSCVLDLRAVLQDGTRFIAEVQIRNQHNMDKRSLFYWSQEFTRSLGKGQTYSELPKVISINIVGFEFMPSGDFHTCYHLKEDRDQTLLTDALEIHFIDMVKWRRQSKKDIVNNPLHRWLTWLDPTSPPELAEEALEMDTAIQKAQEKQDYILRDEEALHHYQMQQMAYWDNISANKYMEEIKKEAENARKEAETALKEGMEKSSMEIARRMKARGRPTDEIAEDTGLSRNVIEKL
ncbi:MAG: Rpn family recombination-promoting nuclease/putative transposase [Treponema sp.]|nr:Rpn family recombination-promoting nuclease/putative transposase [Treponema sp.]